MMNSDVAGDTLIVGCAYDESIVYHKVFSKTLVNYV